MRIGCTLLILVPGLLCAQNDWPVYTHDLAGSHYSPLKQINSTNVAKLAPVWSYKLQGDPAAGPAGRGGGRGGVNSEAPPIVVNGVMYLPAANRIVALEPETGKELWSYPVSGVGLSRRGVAYWPGDRTNPPRIVFTAGPRLIGLNANTGKIDPGFGKEGEVDMTVGYNSVPTSFKNMVMRIQAGSPSVLPAMAAPLTPAPAPKCGISTRCRGLERRVTRPGKAIVGRTALALTSGASTRP